MRIKEFMIKGGINLNTDIKIYYQNPANLAYQKVQLAAYDFDPKNNTLSVLIKKEQKKDE